MSGSQQERTCFLWLYLFYIPSSFILFESPFPSWRFTFPKSQLVSFSFPLYSAFSVLSVPLWSPSLLLVSHAQDKKPSLPFSRSSHLVSNDPSASVSRFNSNGFKPPQHTGKAYTALISTLMQTHSLLKIFFSWSFCFCLSVLTGGYTFLW